MRIFFEEKYYYELIKKIHNGIIEEKTELVELYIESMIKTLHKLRLYEDYPSIAKSLPYLTSAHLKFPGAHSEMTLNLLENLIETRTDESWLNHYGNGKDIPIWYIGSQDLLKISYEYIKNRTPYSNRVYKMLKNILKSPEILAIVS